MLDQRLEYSNLLLRIGSLCTLLRRGPCYKIVLGALLIRIGYSKAFIN